MGGEVRPNAKVRRRRFVAALAFLGLATAAAWALDGRDTASPEKPPQAEQRGVRVERIAIRSSAVSRLARVSVVVPAGGGARPLLVFLHGRGQDDRTLLVASMFGEVKRLGVRAPVVAFPDGGASSYWHDRDSGDWGRYVVEEVIPTVRRRFGTDPRRVAIGGLSMGGFGALDVARLHPDRFCAVGMHSPAIWLTAGDTAEGAFDDAEDFTAHDVLAAARTGMLTKAAPRVWLDAGKDDPFRPGQDALLAALRATGAKITARFPPGTHDMDYWTQHWPQYLRFYRDALADCG